MSGPSFISSALKVILIGAVMAIGAGGFYVLAAKINRLWPANPQSTAYESPLPLWS